MRAKFLGEGVHLLDSVRYPSSVIRCGGERMFSLSAAVARLQEDPAYAQAISRFQALPVSAEQATPDGLTRMLQLAISLQK